MIKKLFTLVLFLTIGAQMMAQNTNRCWSIDYETWNTTGQPALYIDCGNDNAFNSVEEITMEVWARAYTFAENRKILGKIQYAEPIDNGYVLGFENLHVYPEYFNPIIQQIPRPGDGPMPPDSSFVHIVSTYSGITGKIQSYVNGVLSGETTMFPSASIVPNDMPFIIGNAPWDMLSFQFYGDMDEVRIWDFAKTQEQIQNGMHHQLLGTEEGLVAYYNFNNAEGEVVPDNSTNQLDGVLSNYDHESTSWAISSAPVGDETMATMKDIGAIWYRNSENYHKLITENGIIVIGNIPEKDFRKYLVAGHNGNDGVANTFTPDTQPVDFIRTNREWYFNCTQNFSGGLTITIEDAGTNGEFPVDANPENYALLYRESAEDNFRALYHPIVPFEGIFQFNNIEFSNGYYALGYSSEIFELQGPDGIENTIFEDLMIGPNPVKDRLIIEGVPENTRVSVYNINGQIAGIYILNNKSNTINLSENKPGVYFLRLDYDGQKTTKKIIRNN